MHVCLFAFKIIPESLIKVPKIIELILAGLEISAPSSPAVVGGGGSQSEGQSCVQGFRIQGPALPLQVQICPIFSTLEQWGGCFYEETMVSFHMDCLV